MGVVHAIVTRKANGQMNAFCGKRVWTFEHDPSLTEIENHAKTVASVLEQILHKDTGNVVTVAGQLPNGDYVYLPAPNFTGTEVTITTDGTVSSKYHDKNEEEYDA